jgi:hypothetical protein
LTAANHAHAVALLGMADEVRGFGPVKLSAVAAYRQRVREAEGAYFALKAPPAPLARAPIADPVR